MADTVNFRHNVAVPVAGVVATIALVPLAGSRSYLLPLFVIPLLVTAWGWRSGVDVDQGGVVVRALFGARRVPWDDVAGFRTAGRRVYLLLDGDREVALPAVAPGDLTRLIEAGGGTAPRQAADSPEEGPAAGRSEDGRQ